MKNIRVFIVKFSVFGGEIVFIYLNRRVFVMKGSGDPAHPHSCRTYAVRSISCFAVNTIMVDNFATPFNCTTVGRLSTD